MPRYIDADKIKYRYLPIPAIGDFFVTKADVDAIPIADVLDVVRCKDCVHFCPYEVVEDFDGRCTARGGDADKDDFCNYGVRADIIMR